MEEQRYGWLRRTLRAIGDYFSESDIQYVSGLGYAPSTEAIKAADTNPLIREALGLPDVSDVTLTPEMVEKIRSRFAKKSRKSKA